MRIGHTDLVRTREQRLREAPFSLCLSAGFFGFFAHTGILSELEARELWPERITGASAGALAGGLWGMGVPLDEMRERLLSVRREDFWDPGLPVLGLLRGHAFEGILDDILSGLGRKQLEQAQIPMTAVVWDMLSRRSRHVSQGSAARAIRASCALPVMFRPVRVDGRWSLDGGASDREATSPLRVDDRALICSLPHSTPWPEFGLTSKRTDGPRRLRFEPQALPKVSPFALERGELAMHSARRQFADWLDGPA